MRYLLHQKHYIDGRVWEPGEEIETDMPPTAFMEPLDDAALAASRKHWDDTEKKAIETERTVPLIVPGGHRQPWHDKDWKMPKRDKPERPVVVLLAKDESPNKGVAPEPALAPPPPVVKPVSVERVKPDEVC